MSFGKPGSNPFGSKPFSNYPFSNAYQSKPLFFNTIDLNKSYGPDEWEEVDKAFDYYNSINDLEPIDITRAYDNLQPYLDKYHPLDSIEKDDDNYKVNHRHDND